MKTDRLYAITLYLLNHGKTSASELARRMEVSVRTIQRDIDALCRAGVPVIAEPGAAGGYSLADAFRLDAQTATKEEYSTILTALKGLSTAMETPGSERVLEKISALAGEKQQDIILDFSVLRETDGEAIAAVRRAIAQRKAVRFGYTNAENISREHTVEPVALIYRWYAWYLLAWSQVRKDYRTYKLVRMNGVEVTDTGFTREHADAETILCQNAGEAQPQTEIRIRCTDKARARAIEYLNGTVIREYEDGGCEMLLRVIEREQLWFGALLSLGDGAEVLAPEHIRQQVRETAEKIIRLYGKL